jgi:hypothetical protein
VGRRREEPPRTGVARRRAFAGAEQVYTYIGRYTHRVGIANSRLLHFDGQRVTFRTKQKKTVTLTLEEFLRRFVQHVLPKGFVKIRHYGLLAPGHSTTTLETARHLLEAKPTAPERPCDATPRCDASDNVSEAPDRGASASAAEPEPKLCTQCGVGPMIPYPLSVLLPVVDVARSSSWDTS